MSDRTYQEQVIVVLKSERDNLRTRLEDVEGELREEERLHKEAREVVSGTVALLYEAEKQRDEAVAALPDPDLLEMLAMWCDQHDVEADIAGEEIQHDLREWSAKARVILANAQQRREKNGK